MSERQGADWYAWYDDQKFDCRCCGVFVIWFPGSGWNRHVYRYDDRERVEAHVKKLVADFNAPLEVVL